MVACNVVFKLLFYVIYTATTSLILPLATPSKAHETTEPYDAYTPRMKCSHSESLDYYPAHEHPYQGTSRHPHRGIRSGPANR
jgi:hypothetical protein